MLRASEGAVGVFLSWIFSGELVTRAPVSTGRVSVWCVLPGLWGGVPDEQGLQSSVAACPKTPRRSWCHCPLLCPWLQLSLSCGVSWAVKGRWKWGDLHLLVMCQDPEYFSSHFREVLVSDWWHWQKLGCAAERCMVVNELTCIFCFLILSDTVSSESWAWLMTGIHCAFLSEDVWWSEIVVKCCILRIRTARAPWVWHVLDR